MSGVLLDTHAVVFAAAGTLTPTATAILERLAADEGSIFISSVSAWELADNARKGRSLAAYLLPTPEDWYARFLERGVREVPLDSRIAFASARLPRLHGDPIDRFLIASARHLGVSLMTRDAGMQAYADAGLVELTPC